MGHLDEDSPILPYFTILVCVILGSAIMVSSAINNIPEPSCVVIFSDQPAAEIRIQPTPVILPAFPQRLDRSNG